MDEDEDSVSDEPMEVVDNSFVQTGDEPLETTSALTVRFNSKLKGG